MASTCRGDGMLCGAMPWMPSCTKLLSCPGYLASTVAVSLVIREGWDGVYFFMFCGLWVVGCGLLSRMESRCGVLSVLCIQPVKGDAQNGQPMQQVGCADMFRDPSSAPVAGSCVVFGGCQKNGHLQAIALHSVMDLSGPAWVSSVAVAAGNNGKSAQDLLIATTNINKAQSLSCFVLLCPR